MVEVLNEDYITTAKGKGLANYHIYFRHALKNAFIPVLTMLGIQFAFMLGGSVVIEQIFSIPGMGLLAFEAVTTRDYNVVMAVATIGGVMNLIGLLFGDIAYAMVDPRISFENSV